MLRISAVRVHREVSFARGRFRIAEPFEHYLIQRLHNSFPTVSLAILFYSILLRATLIPTRLFRGIITH
ncbi:hypothetical protein MES4922_180004 [Mesorhizobium ventifaucium]|uniref:Uncharacterized protein n=1 Tax=Mesorhizobium ventifaucium TaxID=666020 RepID=A0ABM9DJT6_9HYPH|nr:hypothetical protein MES4922_180004 [Mesorhizobium ventifaucium]